MYCIVVVYCIAYHIHGFAVALVFDDFRGDVTRSPALCVNLTIFVIYSESEVLINRFMIYIGIVRIKRNSKCTEYNRGTYGDLHTGVVTLTSHEQILWFQITIHTYIYTHT